VFLVAVAGCGSPLPPATLEARPGQTITVAFGGDVNLGRRQNAITARDGAAAALTALDVLREADAAIVNLESVVAPGGNAVVEKGERAPYYFRGRPEQLNILIEGGIDGVATANNHSGDYGSQALLEQGVLLDAAGIVHAGSGADLEAACAPRFLGGDSVAIALISVDATMPYFGAGSDAAGTCFLPLDDHRAWGERIGPVIEAARRHAHAVLVAVHWGPNGDTEPSEAKRSVGRLLVRLGADAVLGSSAHVLQGIEVVDGRPIIHDAGNLLFDSQEGPADSAVFVLTVGADGIVGVEPVPVISDYGFTRMAGPEERNRIIELLTERSARLGTTMTRDGVRLDPPTRSAPPDPFFGEPGGQRATPREKEPPDGCVVPAVPDAAEIAPVQIGPLRLIGVSVDERSLHPEGLVWIDSYWRVDERPTEDLWLSPRILTATGDTAWRGDHEPCDWAWPTSRMEPGAIYRDRAPVRPRDVPLQGSLTLQWALSDGREVVTPFIVTGTITPPED